MGAVQHTETFWEVRQHCHIWLVDSKQIAQIYVVKSTIFMFDLKISIFMFDLKKYILRSFQNISILCSIWMLLIFMFDMVDWS